MERARYLDMNSQNNMITIRVEQSNYAMSISSAMILNCPHEQT